MFVLKKYNEKQFKAKVERIRKPNEIGFTAKFENPFRFNSKGIYSFTDYNNLTRKFKKNKKGLYYEV